MQTSTLVKSLPNEVEKIKLKNLSRRGAANRTVDYLGILSDPEYMAGVKEKLTMIVALEAPRIGQFDIITTWKNR